MTLRPPPKYPRVAHLAPAAGVTVDDLVLTPAERERLLSGPVVVEEKLDGANVVLWSDGGDIEVAMRGGPGSIDRGGQRGRIKAWAARDATSLRETLGTRFALYAEWLLRRHAVPYDALPAPLVGLDLLDRERGELVGLDERDELLDRCRVPAPPRIFDGTLASVADAGRLLGKSAFGPMRAEGIVVRTRGSREPRIAKLLDARWGDVGNLEWAHPSHPNTLAS